MDGGADMIGMIKTNTRDFCKDNTENLTKYCKGDSYLMLKIKSTVSGERPLIDIGYKYNVRKILYFVATEDTGSTSIISPIYPSTPTRFLFFLFSLLLVLFS